MKTKLAEATRRRHPFGRRETERLRTINPAPLWPVPL